jgi:hypothetical protein
MANYSHTECNVSRIDETMLKMMAADNDDAYNLTPAFILETVAAARGFLARNVGNVTKVPGQYGDHVRIAGFLAWPQERVKHALAQLHAIEQGELSKKAVESLPTIHAATTFDHSRSQLRLTKSRISA